MVQAPENLRKFLLTFKDNLIPLQCGLFTNKSIMGNSSVCYEVIFLPIFVISFYFLIYKLFTHIIWASIRPLKIDEKETSAGFCIPVGADDQCTALCVALELAGGG